MSAPLPDRPFEIAPRVWWVGHHLPGDPFQCHVYLIENGDSSVLIDPGSVITWPEVRAKVLQVVPLSHIRWVIAHHPDPDVICALPALVPELSPDAQVVTHWRSAALLKHFGTGLPFYLVDEHSWELRLSDRVLRFLFTPYLHFPGSICTLDTATGVLFSSDLFGGFTDDWKLYAESADYFESMRPFHEHYVPSREILIHGLEQVRRAEPRLIAPQHGSLIPQALISDLIGRLESLDCGLYLQAIRDSQISHLVRLSDMTRRMTEAMVLQRDFPRLAPVLTQILSNLFPIAELRFYVDSSDGRSLEFTPETAYHGVQGAHEPPATGPRVITVPLPGLDPATVTSARAELHLATDFALTPETEQALDHLAQPLGIALERQIALRRLDESRAAAVYLATHDPLTGLYNRHHMLTVLPGHMEIQDRDPSRSIAVLVFDIDHFKRVNDTWGHPAGDDVIRLVADTIRKSCRTSDMAVRLGGEEFALFLLAQAHLDPARVGERIRRSVESTILPPPMESHRLTLSVGTAVRAPHEPLDRLLARVDAALYRAKNQGRNRVVQALPLDR